MSLDDIKRRGNHSSQTPSSSPSSGVHNQPLIIHTLRRDLHEASFRGLIRREMHSSKRRIHQHSGPIRRIERSKPFLTHYPLHTVPNPLVPTVPQLQPLLHHVHRRQHRVAGHGGADARRRVCRRVAAGVPLGEFLLAGFVDGEVDGVGGPSAEAHGADAAVEGRRAFRLENGLEGVTDRYGFDGAGAYGLHAGLDGVNGEHGHVLDAARDGSGDHELPEVEAVVS